MSQGKSAILFSAGICLLVILFFAVILIGAVSIPATEVLGVLFGKEAATPYVEIIVVETRLPMAIGATCCGALLSVAGLMMQTTFHNPLAGPSVLGISSGASFGVALLMLGAGGMSGLAGGWQPIVQTAAALAGGLLTIIVLYLFSSVLKSSVTVLIVGLMISYLCTSGISLLNYFSSAEEIRNYMVWGLGSFSALRLSSAVWMAGMSVAAVMPAMFYVKPLNALLLGERHLESVGYSARKIRGGILIMTGLMVAIPTAFCGPIGFLGLIVPHMCRLLFGSSNHAVLLPASLVYGATVSLACALIGVLPSAEYGVLPINVITPVIGVPVILYLLVRRDRIPYFS